MSTFKAIISKSSRRSFFCINTKSGEEFSALALGNLLKKGESLVVGDEVDIKYDEKLNLYEIIGRGERKNLIFRRIIRENKIKPIASNLDALVILCTVSQPEYKRGMLDRYIMRAYQWKIPTTVIFNKIDQSFKDKLDLDFEIERLNELDINFFCLSATETHLTYKNYPAYGEFKDFLKHKTSIFLGQSGVGKSKLISALSDQKITLLSQEIGKVGKGTHTTTWTEMIRFKDFNIVDSPGVRTLSIQDITREELDGLFPDLQEYFNECKFKNCKHLSDSHKCRFHQEDTPEKVLSRLESYLRVRDEIEEIPHWKRS